MAGADETHLATMRNGIDDMLPVIDQPGLQGPGRHPGCRLDAIAQVLGTLAQVFRGSSAIRLPWYNTKTWAQRCASSM